MSTLTFSSKKLFGRAVGESSPFPAMRDALPSTIEARLGEFDGLFINYGMFDESLPYQMQDNYDAEECRTQSYQSVVLENSHLRAEFVPSLGARLWSLYDKDRQRNLLLDNHELRIRNLAIRNAWFAGGIEYNIGRRGHDAQTCSPRFCATLQDTDGTPVFRVYEFSRDRAIPFQIDFYLPEQSRFLLARVRIMNIRDTTVPMYWWSNLALAEKHGARVIVPAKSTFANYYDAGSHFITRIPLPDGEGFDGTYPTNFPFAHDHFYDIPADKRKFEALIEPNGDGFLYASTRRLQGRKLFVWGQGKGGHNWQHSLVADDCPDYLELQGGIAKTQQEHLPMPPKTTWEWLEAYGAFQADPSQVFGNWDTAVEHVTTLVDEAIPETWLDAELERTRESFATRPGQIVCTGSAWGALEEKRLGHRLVPYLDFGTTGEEQKDWCSLLEDNAMPADGAPLSFMIQDEWEPLLDAAPANWKTLFHSALYDYRRHQYRYAEDKIRKSLAFVRNPWNLFALANIQRVQGQYDASALTMMEAVQMRPDDASLAKEALKSFLAMNISPEVILKCHSLLSPEVQARPLVQFCHAWALGHSGRLAEAEEILCANGGLVIPDLREGENSAAELFIFLQQQKAMARGETLSPKNIQVPDVLDFRMS